MAFGNHFRFRRDGSRRGDVGNNNPHQNGNLMERKVAKAQGRKAQKLTLGLPSCVFAPLLLCVESTCHRDPRGLQSEPGLRHLAAVSATSCRR